MTARDLLDHFRSRTPWVDWAAGHDALRHGDPDRTVRRIGTGWSACLGNLSAAAAKGCDLFLCHEDPLLAPCPGNLTMESYNVRRRDLMDRAGMTLLNLHDTWDHFPGYGIRDGFAKLLGLRELEFELDYVHPWSPQVTTGGRSIGLYRIAPVTLDRFCRQALQRMKRTGERCLKVHGDPGRRIRRVAIGVGCHIPGHEALEAGADVLVMVHDRAMQWDVRIPLEESGACTIVIEHGTAEILGMRTMKDYLTKEFPGIRCFFFAHEPTYRVHT